MGFTSGTGPLGVVGGFAAIVLSSGDFKATVAMGLVSGAGTPEVLGTFAAIGGNAIERLT